MTEQTRYDSNRNESIDLSTLDADQFSCLSPSELLDAVRGTRSLDRLRVARTMAATQYNAAQEAGNEDEITAYFDTYSQISKQLEDRWRTYYRRTGRRLISVKY